MHPNDTIVRELQDQNSFLADVPCVNPFRVPEDYFETLPLWILKHASSSDENFSTGSSAVSAGYFESFPATVLAKLKEFELTDLQKADESFLSAGFSTENIFTVPEGYFDAVAENVLQNVKRPLAKVAHIRKNIPLFKYALAACLVGLLGMSLFSMLNGKNDILQNPAQITVSNTSNQNTLLAEASVIIKQHSFDREMEALNAVEIQDYLRLSGENVDAALAASVTDDNSLPDESEYFFDDNTLNRLLNHNGLKEAAIN